jgi:aryl carrier-like protein
MTIATPTIERLRALPRSERRDALQTLVIAEFKTALLMTEREELPVDANYFEFGLSSLSVVEVKQRLDELLGCGIDTALLFSNPTVETLMSHLTTEALRDLFLDDQAQGASSATSIRPLVDSLLQQLYDA